LVCYAALLRLSGHFRRLTANVNPLRLRTGALVTVNANSRLNHK